jgi:hypothetical protein
MVSAIVVFNINLSPMMPPFAMQIVYYSFLPSQLVLVPLAIFTSWRARKYLLRFPKRDFAMNILLAFNLFSVVFSCLILCLALSSFVFFQMFNPVMR